MSELWGCLVLGLLVTYLGAIKIITGEDGTLWGVTVPAWTGWVYLPLGILFLALTFRGYLRGEGKPKKVEYTDEDIAKAKADLDSMYLKKYGELPKCSPESPQKTKGPEADAATPERKA